VWVRGEISNVQQPPSGHLYFTLKDPQATVACVMFARAAMNLRFALQDGLEVLVRGHVSVFERRGQYQLYIHEVEPAGLGSLHLAFEQLKARLLEDGLFDPARKRPMPALPRRVALVTSASGAAVQDMIRIAHRRFPGLPLIVIPVLVQGQDAPADIVRGVGLVPSTGADVAIVGRGGGSLEELWAFNTEPVARAVLACPVPVVSAVGHETDVTIADLVADLRAPTPSAAAELVVPERAVLEREVSSLAERSTLAARRHLALVRREFTGVWHRRVFQDPATLLEESREDLDHLTLRIAGGVRGITAPVRTELDGVVRRIASGARALTAVPRSELSAVTTRIATALSASLDHRRAELREIAGRVDALSPFAVLARGYSVCRTPGGVVVERPADAPVGTDVDVLLADGRLSCRVLGHGQRHQEAL